MSKILVIGDIILDKYILGTVDRISPEAPIPVLDVKQVEYRLGGAANVAANIHGRCNVTLRGVGGFNFFKEYTNLIAKTDVQSRVDITNSDFMVKTRLATLDHHYISRYDNIEWYKNSFLTPSMLEKDFGAADIIIVSDYAKNTLNPEVYAVLERYRKYKVVIVDSKNTDSWSYKNSYLFTPNTKELDAILGKGAPPDYILQFMRDNNIRYLLHTKGAQGMDLHYQNGKVISIPAYKPKQVFDVTGAGDIVIAKVAEYLAKDLSIEAAVQEANYFAGQSVQQFGTVII